MQSLRTRGIFCAADNQIRPFTSDLPTILRAIEAAAYVGGMRVLLDSDHVAVLQGHLAGSQQTIRLQTGYLPCCPMCQSGEVLVSAAGNERVCQECGAEWTVTPIQKTAANPS